MLVDQIKWTCFDMILISELLLGVSVTMGTRLERTEVTLCGSNTELIHRVFPSWEFHMVSSSSHQGHAVFSSTLLSLPATTTHLCRQHTFTYAHSHTFIPEHLRQFPHFTAGCLLVSAWYCSSLQAFQKRSLVIISPSLLFGAGVLSFCTGTFSHQASFRCSLTNLSVLVVGKLTAHHSCLSCCQANNSFLMVHNIRRSRSASYIQYGPISAWLL